jgi:hypothetical protein
MYRHIASGAAALLLVAQSALPVAALKNGLAVTPQLGWVSMNLSPHLTINNFAREHMVRLRLQYL